MRKAVLPFLVALALLPMASVYGSPTSLLAASQAPAHTWTIMIYMADDYLVDLPWQENLAAMQRAQQAPGTTVVALVDLPGNGNTRLLRIQQGSNTTIDDNHLVVPPSQEVDMASPDTLQAFAGFCAATFPADYYILVLWGHADTWIGLCPDGTDILTLPELRAALEGAKTDIGKPIDMVAADACSVASVEILRELDGLTRYFVGSEKDIPFEGLPYGAILDGLGHDPGQSVADFGESIVDEYIDWARFNSTYSSEMAMINMSRLGSFFDALDSLSLQGCKYDSLFHSTIRTAFQQSESYETGWFVDAESMFRRLLVSDLPTELCTAATRAALSLSRAVEHIAWHDLDLPIDGTHVYGPSGAVIYSPSVTTPDTMYANLSIASSPWYAFGRLARHDGVTNGSSEGPTVTLNKTVEAASATISLQWPAGTGAVEALIYRHEPGGIVPLGGGSSTEGNLSFDGFAGRLVISASASEAGVATSYARIEATVPVSVMVNVTMFEHGERSGGRYRVSIMLDGQSYNLTAKDGQGAIVFSVPAQGDVNSLMRITVYERGSGRPIAESNAFLRTTDTYLEVEVSNAPPATSPWPYLMIALLPGCLLLIYAALLWKGSRKRDDRD